MEALPWQLKVDAGRTNDDSLRVIAVLDPVAAKTLPPVYQLKVVLLGTRRPIWRRLQVPESANLGWLHAVLQVAMGWTNSHLHQFRIGQDCYSDTRVHFAEFVGDPEILEERKFTLMQVVPCEKAVFGYEYDFGDSWEHEVIVEKVLPPDLSVSTVARCLDGARACPPEDCGGTWGYENLLKVLRSPKHPEHEDLKTWLGKRFDAEAFSVETANLWLGKLKWPKVTEAQLRKVLMARDGDPG